MRTHIELIGCGSCAVVCRMLGNHFNTCPLRCGDMVRNKHWPAVYNEDEANWRRESWQTHLTQRSSCPTPTLRFHQSSTRASLFSDKYSTYVLCDVFNDCPHFLVTILACMAWQGNVCAVLGYLALGLKRSLVRGASCRQIGGQQARAGGQRRRTFQSSSSIDCGMIAVSRIRIQGSYTRPHSLHSPSVVLVFRFQRKKGLELIVIAFSEVVES